MDVGYRRHSVAMGLPSGEVLEEFEIAHRPEGFAGVFFSHREASEDQRLRGGGGDGRVQWLRPAVG